MAESDIPGIQHFVRIFDTTLRDGEQTPGVALTPEKKLQIARQLDRLGVDTIEAGFPITSQGEREAIKLIARDGLKPEICALARAEKEDINAALACGVYAIHIFIAASDLHLKYKLRITREEALRNAVEAIEYAKRHGVTVEFSAEDATRADEEFLVRFFRAASEAGADRLDIPDTVGVMTPERMSNLVTRVYAACAVPISVHCHDDFGLAVANTLAGIKAGATQAHVTVNGIGERAGNTSLEEVVMALHQLKGVKTRVNTKLLYETSRLVSKLTGVIVQPNKAIVGENAFGHESGIHTHGILANPLTYEPFDPSALGRRRWLQAGKHAGTHGIEAQLKAMRLYPSREELKEILGKVKELGDMGKRVTDSDLYLTAIGVMKRDLSDRELVKLLKLEVKTGIDVVPTAHVELRIGEKTHSRTEVGVGPIDAAIKAIQSITTGIANIRLKEYRLDAITGGSDAPAESVIVVEDKDGYTASARAIGDDVVVTSVQAMIQGINAILLKTIPPTYVTGVQTKSSLIPPGEEVGSE